MKFTLTLTGGDVKFIQEMLCAKANRFANKQASALWSKIEEQIKGDVSP